MVELEKVGTERLSPSAEGLRQAQRQDWTEHGSEGTHFSSKHAYTTLENTPDARPDVGRITLFSGESSATSDERQSCFLPRLALVLGLVSSVAYAIIVAILVTALSRRFLTPCNEQ
jgi:hypothetical protein